MLKEHRPSVAELLYQVASKYPKRPYQIEGMGWVTPNVRTFTVKSGCELIVIKGQDGLYDIKIQPFNPS